MDLTTDASFINLGPGKAGTGESEAMTAELFAELLHRFYERGWMKGTGGAFAVREGTTLFVSPSSLQKDFIKFQDVFVYNLETKSLVSRAVNPKINVSSCGVLFTLIMSHTGTQCVIHTHSKSANLITQLLREEEEFEISHQEYIKGVYDPFTGGNMKYEGPLTIPIISNKPTEDLLLDSIRNSLEKYPRSPAVLVRNHGIFVWGPTWERTKITTECIEYLLELAIEMKRCNLRLCQEHEATEKFDIMQTVFSE